MPPQKYVRSSYMMVYHYIHHTTLKIEPKKKNTYLVTLPARVCIAIWLSRSVEKKTPEYSREMWLLFAHYMKSQEHIHPRRPNSNISFSISFFSFMRISFKFKQRSQMTPICLDARLQSVLPHYQRHIFIPYKIIFLCMCVCVIVLLAPFNDKSFWNRIICITTDTIISS